VTVRTVIAILAVGRFTGRGEGDPSFFSRPTGTSRQRAQGREAHLLSGLGSPVPSFKREVLYREQF